MGCDLNDPEFLYERSRATRIKLEGASNMVDSDASVQTAEPPKRRPVKLESPSSSHLLRRMYRNYNSRDGVGFRRVIGDINEELRDLKARGILRKAPEAWKGMKLEVLLQIYEETYQRSAGPRVKELLKYQAFSSDTYGELNTGWV